MSSVCYCARPSRERFLQVLSVRMNDDIALTSGVCSPRFASGKAAARLRFGH